jgi:hypothetical protein
MTRTTAGLLVVLGLLLLGFGPVPAGAASRAPAVTWYQGARPPGTPARFDRVGVIKVGPASARNVLVLEPGTSAGGAYFLPLARWIVARTPGWQVWSVERRENLLEDQSEMDRFKAGRASATDLFNYYLGYLKNPAVKRHVTLVPADSVTFAKQWGMAVAVEDLHRVIGAAASRGGKVVLGGHSLGGAVVTAYATWDFGGHPGADQLAGLVYIDGASGPAESGAAAAADLRALNAPTASPWLSFGGIAAPYAGIFSATGAAAALLDPAAPSLGQTSGLLPSSIVPPVPASNLGQFGYALNVATSPPSLVAAQAHLGTGLAPVAVNGVHGWNGQGALTPIRRFATMFSGFPLRGVDGSEWYFPQRLTDDTAGVNNGVANPAQALLGLRSTMGRALPQRLLLYAFGARLGGAAVLASTRTLAAQSGIPRSHLVLVNRQSTYAHNDPAGAYPANTFVAGLLPFLRRVARTPG